MPVTAPRGWVDVFELDYFASDGSFGGFVVMGLYPAVGRGWFWASVVGADRPLVLVVDDEMPLPAWPNLEVRSTGIWTDLIAQVPLVHFTVGLEAFGVGLDDPAEVFTGLRGDLTPLGFDLEWETRTPAWALPGGGFELGCSAHGEILVGHEEFDFEGRGTRRRWTGPDERRFESGMWLSGWWDDDEPLVGRSCGLEKRLSAEHLQLSAGEERFDVVVMSVAPVPVVGVDGQTSQRWRMLCRIDAQGRTGTGWLDLR